jgi:2-aminomuconate deaminase
MQTSSENIHASGAPDPVGAYPHARRVGNLLFLSGIGPRTPGTNAIPGNEYDEAGNLLRYDIEAQCHSLFANVRTVLEASGSNWDSLVDVTVYLTNMKADFARFNQLYTQYFGHLPAKPCRTTVEVGALPTAIAIELKCIAVVE